MMFIASDGDIFKREKLEQEYSTLETLKLIYLKQVKTLKEMESLEK